MPDNYQVVGQDAQTDFASLAVIISCTNGTTQIPFQHTESCLDLPTMAKISKEIMYSTTKMLQNYILVSSQFIVRSSQFIGNGKAFEMECKKDSNMDSCNCSYPDCSRKGICCECLQHHLKSKQLPGCCFSDDVEKTYDRSFKAFAAAWNL